ncbi:unnamed protein product, partial [Ectocarpus sp. 12 AP-2014]
REAFLRFFVTFLSGYRRCLVYPTKANPNPARLFNMDDYLDKLDRDSRPFAEAMCDTQAFQNFIDARIQPETDDLDVVFFDACIAAKRNRSMLHVTKKSDANFLRPDTFVKAKTVFALTPDTTGLDMTAPARSQERNEGSTFNKYFGGSSKKGDSGGDGNAGSGEEGGGGRRSSTSLAGRRGVFARSGSSRGGGDDDWSPLCAEATVFAVFIVGFCATIGVDPVRPKRGAGFATKGSSEPPPPSSPPAVATSRATASTTAAASLTPVAVAAEEAARTTPPTPDESAAAAAAVALAGGSTGSASTAAAKVPAAAATSGAAVEAPSGQSSAEGTALVHVEAGGGEIDASAGSASTAAATSGAAAEVPSGESSAEGTIPMHGEAGGVGRMEASSSQDGTNGAVCAGGDDGDVGGGGGVVDGVSAPPSPKAAAAAAAAAAEATGLPEVAPAKAPPDGIVTGVVAIPEEEGTAPVGMAMAEEPAEVSTCLSPAAPGGSSLQVEDATATATPKTEGSAAVECNTMIPVVAQAAVGLEEASTARGERSRAVSATGGGGGGGGGDGGRDRDAVDADAPAPAVESTVVNSRSAGAAAVTNDTKDVTAAVASNGSSSSSSGSGSEESKIGSVDMSVRRASVGPFSDSASSCASSSASSSSSSLSAPPALLPALSVRSVAVVPGAAATTPGPVASNAGGRGGEVPTVLEEKEEEKKEEGEEESVRETASGGIGAGVKVRKSSRMASFSDLKHDVQEERLYKANAALMVAFEALDAMREKAPAGEEAVYRSLISACGRCGNSEKAMAVVEMMMSTGIVPDAMVSRCLVDAFAMDDSFSDGGAHPLSLLDWSKFQPKHRDGRRSHEPAGGRTEPTFSLKRMMRRFNEKSETTSNATPPRSPSIATVTDAAVAASPTKTTTTRFTAKSTAGSIVMTPESVTPTRHTSSVASQQDFGILGNAVFSSPCVATKARDSFGAEFETPERRGSGSAGGTGRGRRRSRLEEEDEDVRRSSDLRIRLKRSAPPYARRRGMSMAMQEQVLMGEKMLERLFQDLKASATHHPEIGTDPWIDNGSETCPSCQAELTGEQVRAGWSSDPNDYTTECRAVVDRQAAAEAAAGVPGTGWGEGATAGDAGDAVAGSGGSASRPGSGASGGGAAASATLPAGKGVSNGGGGGGGASRRKSSSTSTVGSSSSSSKASAAKGTLDTCGRRFVSRFSVHSTLEGWEGTTGP